MLRLMTELKNPEKIKRIIHGFGLDYTVFIAQGCWRGVEEPSLVVEFDDASLKAVIQIAIAVKRLNEQQAVLIQRIRAQSRFV